MYKSSGIGGMQEKPRVEQVFAFNRHVPANNERQQRDGQIKTYFKRIYLNSVTDKRTVLLLYSAGAPTFGGEIAT